MKLIDILLDSVIGSVVAVILGRIGILLKRKFNKRYMKIKIINKTGVPLPGKGKTEFFISQ